MPNILTRITGRSIEARVEDTKEMIYTLITYLDHHYVYVHPFLNTTARLDAYNCYRDDAVRARV